MFECEGNRITHIPLSIIHLQNLKIFTYDQNIFKPPLIKYFLNNLHSENIKQYCYNLIWKVQMEF